MLEKILHEVRPLVAPFSEKIIHDAIAADKKLSEQEVEMQLRFLLDQTEIFPYFPKR